MLNVLVELSHQRAFAIPLMRADDMHALGLKSIGSAHHGSDIEIVGPVLHRHFEIVAAVGIEIFFDGLHSPVAISVEHIAAIALIEQSRIETDTVIRRCQVIRTRFAGMGFSPWAKTDFTEFRFARGFCRQGNLVGCVHSCSSEIINVVRRPQLVAPDSLPNGEATNGITSARIRQRPERMAVRGFRQWRG